MLLNFEEITINTGNALADILSPALLIDRSTLVLLPVPYTFPRSFRLT